MISATLPRLAAATVLAVLVGLGAATGTAAAAPADPAAAGPAALLGHAVPASEPDAISRPENGDVVVTRGGRGSGRVEIAGGPSDAVLTLAQDGRAMRSIYVRAGQRTSTDGVPDGSYVVYVTSGSGWDDAAQRFTRDATYERWPGESDFVTSRVRGGTDYSVWTFTLTEAPDGNVTPEPVTEDRFPR